MESLLTCRNHPDVVEGLRYCSRCGQAFCHDCLVDIQGNSFCAACKSEQMLDIASGVNPNALELADIGRRFVAIFIDGCVIVLPFMILMVAMIFMTASGNSNAPPPGLLTPIVFLPAIGYVVYEGLMLAARGQTLGKMAMKIRVVRPDGQPISTGQAWGRAFMRQILASCLSLFNYLPAFFTKEKTCLHDLVANTRVVNWS